MKNNPTIDRLREFWNGLQPREKKVLKAGALLLALAIFVQVFWSMLDARNRFQKQIPELTQQLEFVENGKREWARLLEHSGKVLQSSHQNSEAIIKSAEKIGVTAAWKTASSLKATGVSSFDDFVNWLEFLRTNYGLKPIAAKIEKAGEGLVRIEVEIVSAEQ